MKYLLVFLAPFPADYLSSCGLFVKFPEVTVLVDFLKGRIGEEAEADLFRRETPLVGRTALVVGSCTAGNCTAGCCTAGSCTAGNWTAGSWTADLVAGILAAAVVHGGQTFKFHEFIFDFTVCPRSN